MSHAYVVEIGEEPVGIIAREAKVYRFYASKASFRTLNGQVFDNAQKAHHAALNLHRRASTTRSALTSLSATSPSNDWP